MSGQGRPAWRRSVAALAACAAILLAAAPGVRAQSAEGGTGRVLSFSVATGLRATDNPDFRLHPSGSEVRATADLRLGLRADTPLSSLTLDADMLLLARLKSDEGRGGERARQGLRLGYGREGVGAALRLEAFIDESRIDFLRPLTDFLNEDGEIVLPDDLDDLTGDGWRRQRGFDASLTLGREAPFGVVLGAGLSELDYRDASNPALRDSRRSHAAARMHFDLNPVTRLDLGLRYSVFSRDDDRRETWSLNPGLTFARPDGNIRFLLGATRTEDGTRVSGELGRLIERPWGSLDARIGAVRMADGDTALSGGLRLTYGLPRGRLTVGLDRAAGSSADDDEVLRTALAVSYEQALNDLSSLALNLGYVRSDNSATGLGTDTASLGLGYRRSLTPDWSLNLGYNYRMRDEEGSGRTTENEVSLSLSRSFSFGL